MADPIVVHFTAAEMRVLGELMKDGAENLQIAERLFLSPETVKSHMRKVLRKADVRGRAALVLHLARRRIIAINDQGRVVEF